MSDIGATAGDGVTNGRLTSIIPVELEGARLDVALATLVPGLSRLGAQQLIDQGRVAVARGQARARRPVVAGEMIAVKLPDSPRPIAPSTRKLAMVYEDADVFVVDKPAGLVVHPSPGHPDDTLLNALAGHTCHTGCTPSIGADGEASRPRLVHRLDKDTSGLLVVARTARAQRYLAAQWERHSVVKRYLALVHGRPEPTDGLIDLPLGRDPHNRQRVIPTLAGQPARTRYTIVERYDGFSLLDVQPETGRTHQIRVHLAALGYPVVGDPWYGVGHALPGLRRQFLHAHRLVIRLPSMREPSAFESPLPPDLAAACAMLTQHARP